MSRIERLGNIYKIDDFLLTFYIFFTNKAEFCNLQQMYNFYPRWLSKENESVNLRLI